MKREMQYRAELEATPQSPERARIRARLVEMLAALARKAGK